MKQMIFLKSFQLNVEDFIEKKDFQILTFDIETRDSGSLGIWDAEIISFSFCFTRITGGIQLNPSFHFYGAIIENLEEEKELLKHLLTLLSLCKDIEISGHNIALKHKFTENWIHKGFDLRKIIERGCEYQLETGFLTSLKTYDTIFMAFHHYNHSIVPRFNSRGNKKKMLKSEEIEEDFKIKRPDNIQKLGAHVRKIFDDTQQKDGLMLILRYNIIDTIVEALFILIFKQQLRKYGKISNELPHTVFNTSINIQDLDIYSLIEK